MEAVLTVVGRLVGVALPGILLYVIVQRFVRKRALTPTGFLWVVGISVVIAGPGMRRQLADQQYREQLPANARSSQAAVLNACNDGCRTVGSAISECTSGCSCVLTRLEARYPTDEAWMGFDRRIRIHEASASAEVEGASAACASRR